MERISDLFTQLLECCGVVKLINYKRMSLNDPKPERLVREKGVCGEHNSFFVRPFPHSEKPSLLLMFALDASTHDTQADKYHHTCLNIGDATTGLRKGIEVHGSKRDDETGKFGPMSKIEFDCIFPQLEEEWVDEYLADRMIHGQLLDEFNKYKAKLKEKGIIKKRPYTPSEEDAEETCRIDSFHETVSIKVPKSVRISWKTQSNYNICRRYLTLKKEINKIVFKWKALSGLGHHKIKNDQVMRVIDLGLYETGRVPSESLVIKPKKYSVYVSPETFNEYVEKGRIEPNQVSDGEKVSGVLVERETDTGEKQVVEV